MSALAHVFEAEGIPTLTIGTVATHITKVAPPRGLICHFPLGRPLGKPNDAVFQRRVLTALFDMLDAPAGPVLNEFPEVISDDEAVPLVCALPPRLNPDEHPAVDEARALRNAYERSVSMHGNRIGVGREIDIDQIPAAVEAFARITEGTDWKEAGIPGNPMRVAQDIRGYYQTAALVLSSSSAGAWAGENWFYEQTQTGKLMMKVRSILKASGAPQPLWFYLSPGDRPA